MTVAPIRREILVGAPVDRTFELFTGHIGAWWPLATFSVFGDGTVAFEGNSIIERSGQQTSVWAEVLEWDPPSGLRLAWHPGSDPQQATDVRMTFTPDGDRAVVRVEHAGWEALPDPAAGAQEYDQGWPGVLGGFRSYVAEHDAEQSAPADRWFALLHRPGPALPAGVSLFATEAFGEHVAFLNRLRDRGLLVAAGPLPDKPEGSGMTVIRVRPEHGEVDVMALATADDRCVATRGLTVTVQPWAVMLTG